MKEKIIAICQEINPQIQDGINLENIIDSFSVVNIIMELEMEFDCEIDPEDVVAENFATIDAIVSLVNRTLGN